MRVDEIRIIKDYFKITDEALSELSGVPADTINGILTGKLPPTDRELALLSKVFETGYPKGEPAMREEALDLEYIPIFDDRLTVKDYYDIPDGVRCELINGRIYCLSSPVFSHQNIIGAVYISFVTFISKKKKNCKVCFAPFDVRLNSRNLVQPDLLVVCDDNKFRNDCIHGAPDFVMEVLSPSTAGRDKREKLYLYMSSGVKEYWVVDLDNETVTVHLFDNGKTSIEYTFNDNIPVHITGDELEISISDSLKRMLQDDDR